MQIKELTLPPNQQKITYQISRNGKTNIYTSTKQKDNKLLSVLSQQKIQLGQLNSIQLSQENQLQNILQKNPFYKNKKQQQSSQKIIRQICCSCKKSKCLKMYCQCFANKLFCGKQCVCLSCTNTELNEKKLSIMRLQVDQKKIYQQKGCKCQKSGCNKKYCECFSKNIKCGQFCACLNCTNVDKNKLKVKKQSILTKTDVVLLTNPQAISPVKVE